MSPQTARQPADETPTIPDRLYFRIGDVARLCSVEPYVLRFWETQFPQLKPNKSGTGQRLYRRRDVEMALKIKHLVHEAGYTIQGARQHLEQEPKHREPQPAPLPVQPAIAAVSDKTLKVASVLRETRAGLREIIHMLAESDPRPAPATPTPVQHSRRTRTASASTPQPLLFPA